MIVKGARVVQESQKAFVVPSIHVATAPVEGHGVVNSSSSNRFSNFRDDGHFDFTT